MEKRTHGLLARSQPWGLMVGSATGQAGGLHANWVRDGKCSLLVLNCHLLASSSTDKVPDVHKAGEAALIGYMRVRCILKNTWPQASRSGESAVLLG